jgi:hypothetical protein
VLGACAPKILRLVSSKSEPVAQETLNRIAVLYLNEVEVREMTVDDRQRLHAEKSAPLLSALHDWLY